MEVQVLFRPPREKKKICLDLTVRGILYKTKKKKISGSGKYKEILKKARLIFHEVEKKSRRSAYLRSAYFKGGKIFLNLFWVHLNQKSERERRLRLRFLPCAYDLIEHSRIEPTSKHSPNDKTAILHRFAGMTKEKELFYVQVKENMRTKRRDFMSVFSGKNSDK